MIPPGQFTGHTAWERYMNRLRAWIMSIRILDGPNYRVIQSTNGVYLAIEPKKSKSTGGGGDARWS